VVGAKCTTNELWCSRICSGCCGALCRGGT
jgi:hypothetical protein